MPIDPAQQNDGVTANRRTMKGMQCALAGIPIVTCEWIQHCLLKSKVRQPTSSVYIRTLPSTSGNYDHGVALLAAFRQKSKLAPFPFKHCQIYLSGISDHMEKDINILLREGGAVVLPSTSALTKVLRLNSEPCRQKVVVVCDGILPSNMASKFRGLFDTKNVFFVNSSWVFDSISAGKMLPSINHPPPHISARQLWESMHQQVENISNM